MIVVLLAKYKCRSCEEFFYRKKPVPPTRTVDGIIAEAVMNRPNPTIHVLATHPCLPKRHGIGDIIEITEEEEE